MEVGATVVEDVRAYTEEEEERVRNIHGMSQFMPPESKTGATSSFA